MKKILRAIAKRYINKHAKQNQPITIQDYFIKYPSHLTTAYGESKNFPDSDETTSVSRLTSHIHTLMTMLNLRRHILFVNILHIRSRTLNNPTFCRPGDSSSGLFGLLSRAPVVETCLWEILPNCCV